MHPFRFLPWLAAFALFAGCQTKPAYTKLRVTNHRGELVAEWVARGRVTETERGYRITAVERRSAPPYVEATRYPDGWRTNVVGPHIWRWPCSKPQWLAELDGDPTWAAEHRVSERETNDG